MESRNFQEQNFYNNEQTSAYCEDHITYPLSHLRRTENRRQKWQQEQECERHYEKFNKKQRIFKHGRKHMQSLNFDEQEFLYHNQKSNSSKLYHYHHHHRGNNVFTARSFQSDFVSQKIVTNPSMTLTMEATNFRRDEDSRSARNEDRYSISPTRTQEEKQRRRQEWMRQQKRERQHEKLKQQKILEYERQRAEALKLAKRYSTRHSQDRRDSKSPSSHLQHKERSTSNASKSNTFYEKSDGSSTGEPFFKGPQGIQISDTELRRIKVNIRRNIPAKGPVFELQWDIVNPEDVILQRREGEGCKPIFDRNEIKNHMIEATNREHYKETVSMSKDQFTQTSESSLK